MSYEPDNPMDSFSMNKSPEQLKQDLEEEKKYQQRVEEVVDQIEELIDNEQLEKVDRSWKIGKILIEFYNDYGRKIVNCEKCGARNFSTSQSCHYCNKGIENEESPKKFFDSSVISEKLKERNSAYSVDSPAWKIYAMFPDGEYGDMNSMEAEFITRAWRIPELPQKLHETIMEDGQEQEITDDELEAKNFSTEHRKNKISMYVQREIYKWKLANGVADPEGYPEEHKEDVLAGTVPQDEIEELATAKVIST